MIRKLVVVALVLMPPLTGFSDRVLRGSALSVPASRPGAIEQAATTAAATIAPA